MADTIDNDTGEVLREGIGTELQVEDGMAISLARAEIDVQITTARRYPRDITKASERIRSLATMDEETAEECIYALPRGKKPIRGPSIRLAEMVFQCWGNARAAARVVSVDRDEKVVVAEGVYHDLETNSASSATVRRRIVDSKGRLYSDDMIVVTGNAACSIAKRNAILSGVPKAVWSRAFREADAVVSGAIGTLAEGREKAIKAFAVYGVKPEAVYGALGVGGPDDVMLDHIKTLRAMFSSIKNGEATVEEYFSPRVVGSTHAPVKNPLSDEPDEPAGDKASEKPTDARSENGQQDSGKSETGAGDAESQGAGHSSGTSGAEAPKAAIKNGETLRIESRSDDDGAEIAKVEKAPPPKREIDPADVAAAKKRGTSGRRSGMPRSAVPKEFKAEGSEPLRDAWLDGYDLEVQRQKEAEAERDRLGGI